MQFSVEIDADGNVKGVPDGYILKNARRKVNISEEERKRRREAAASRPRVNGKWAKKQPPPSDANAAPHQTSQ